MPSFWSSVANSAWNTRRSNIRPSASGTSNARLTVSFAAMTERQKALAEIIGKDPDVADVAFCVGVTGGSQAINNGRFWVNLKPRSERTATAQQIFGGIGFTVEFDGEIAVPLIKHGQVIGVLDLDSPVFGRFDESDAVGLEALAAILDGRNPRRGRREQRRR